MAIPDGAVELRDMDMDRLTLDELTLLFDPESLEVGEQVSMFRRFCLAHTNWSRKQVGAITAGELQTVMTKFADALKALAVPKETAPDSKPGPTAST